MPQTDEPFVFGDDQGNYEAATEESSTNIIDNAEYGLSSAVPLINRPRLVFGPSDDWMILIEQDWNSGFVYMLFGFNIFVNLEEI